MPVATTVPASPSSTIRFTDLAQCCFICDQDPPVRCHIPRGPAAAAFISGPEDSACWPGPFFICRTETAATGPGIPGIFSAEPAGETRYRPSQAAAQISLYPG